MPQWDGKKMYGSWKEELWLTNVRWKRHWRHIGHKDAWSRETAKQSRISCRKSDFQQLPTTWSIISSCLCLTLVSFAQCFPILNTLKLILLEVSHAQCFPTLNTLKPMLSEISIHQTDQINLKKKNKWHLLHVFSYISLVKKIEILLKCLIMCLCVCSDCIIIIIIYHYFWESGDQYMSILPHSQLLVKHRQKFPPFRFVLPKPFQLIPDCTPFRHHPFYHSLWSFSGF